MENTIETKIITDLRGMHFIIPSYQRGYRWTRQEVRDLLSDVFEFNSQNGKQKYCLQPFVVRPMPNGKWEVIDGQQRLTTICIIFKVAENVINSVNAPYDLEYETRLGSADFLHNLCESSEARKNDNIDYFYMVNAWDAVNVWLHEQNDYPNAVIQIYMKLISDIQIIWYQINDNSQSNDPVDIFTKINMGKIPLTNAELIKALFLRQENFDQSDNSFTQEGNIYKKQLEISGEWDRIEQSLRDETFWLFITNVWKTYDTRIDFIFDLLAKEENKSLNKPISDISNKYFPFLVFDKIFKEEKEKEKGMLMEDLLSSLWEKIGRYHAVFKEWYKNPKLYHLIGYLIAIGESTAESIKHATEGKKKNEIESYLNKTIQNSLKGIKDLGDLSYDNQNDKRKIQRVLLLFNIKTLILSKASIRFPFDLYKLQNWDIEHIHAIKTKSPETPTSRKEWLLARRSELIDIDSNATNEIDAFILQGGEEDVSKYESFCDILNEKYGELEINDISNLTLLDSTTNRSYKNAYFPVKRRIIIQRDKGSVFVPVCTKNVFLKLYSDIPSDMIRWSEKDRSEYMAEMRRIFDDIIPGGAKNE